ncbi:hypothetical protein BH23GEM11_BH23GEM11_02870 [soil metagenome]
MTNPTQVFSTPRQGLGSLLLLPALLLTVGAFMAPGPVQAQAPVQADAAEDLRWLPWLGCWEPTDELATEGSELLVCITPDRDGARIESLVDGESMGAEFLAGDGSRQDASEGGCEGTRQARFADDGRRLFFLSDLECGLDARRTTRGVFAMGADGFEWIEIQAISAGEGDEPFLSVRRFQTASRATLARHERAEPATDRGLAIETARRSAARAMTAGALTEASDIAGPAVTAALVAEMGQGFDLDARALREYRNQGVAPEVLDMMIAMTWPDRFQVSVDGSVDAVEMARTTDPRYDDRYDARYSRGGYSSYHCTGWLGRCSSFDAWLAYRYGGFGYGYGYAPRGYGYQPYGWYTGPRYIVVDPSGITGRQRGTMTSDGYRPDGGSGATQARPATTRGGTRPQGAPRPATSPAPRAAPSTPATRPTTSSAPPTRPPPRPAQRRGTGGGGDGSGGEGGGSEIRPF